ncbi:hypothetical protein HK104_007046, partial [Borealophlyctis nickersoniae]
MNPIILIIIIATLCTVSIGGTFFYYLFKSPPHAPDDAAGGDTDMIHVFHTESYLETCTVEKPGGAGGRNVVHPDLELGAISTSSEGTVSFTDPKGRTGITSISEIPHFKRSESHHYESFYYPSPSDTIIPPLHDPD